MCHYLGLLLPNLLAKREEKKKGGRVVVGGEGLDTNRENIKHTHTHFVPEFSKCDSLCSIVTNWNASEEFISRLIHSLNNGKIPLCFSKISAHTVRHIDSIPLDIMEQDCPRSCFQLLECILHLGKQEYMSFSTQADVRTQVLSCSKGYLFTVWACGGQRDEHCCPLLGRKWVAQGVGQWAKHHGFSTTRIKALGNKSCHK